MVVLAFYGFIFAINIIGIFVSLHYCGKLENKGDKQGAMGVGVFAFFLFFLSWYTGFFFLSSIALQLEK